MNFELTESLITQILFAMENQKGEYVLTVSPNFDKDNSKKAEIVPLSELELSEFNLQSEFNLSDDVYSLPQWFSSDGFNLLESFTKTIKVLKVKSELQSVLVNGRGVFKNFKNVLKNYPEIEKSFYLFKEQKMRFRIYEWYNSLREVWGLEKLDQSDFFESKIDDDLVAEDFTFRRYDFSTDKKCTVSEFFKISEELKEENPGDVGLILADLWNQKQVHDFKNCEGFVCRTLSDEFAGCILFQVNSKNPTVARESVTLTTCFVNKNYRGFGIARKLLFLCISYLREHGYSNFFIADSLIPQSFEKLLIDLGFEKNRMTFVAKFF